MGHLINPIALRVGWFSTWVDMAFFDRKYYPECLHILLRIRLCLCNFLTNRWMDRQATFFSHLILTKNLQGLDVSIYFYDGYTESKVEAIEEFFEQEKQYFLAVRKLNYRTLSKKFFTFYSLLALFNLCNKFFILEFPRRIFFGEASKRWAEGFLSLDKGKLPRALLTARQSGTFQPKILVRGERREKEWKKVPVNFKSLVDALDVKNVPGKPRTERSWLRLKRLRLRLIFFYQLCRGLILHADLSKGKEAATDYSLFLHRFLMGYSAFYWLKPSFSLVTVYFQALIRSCYKGFLFLPMHNVQIRFYLISNESVTAAFLSRYMARKFRQRFTLKWLLRTVKMELIRVARGGLRQLPWSLPPLEKSRRDFHNRTFFSHFFRHSIEKSQKFYFQERACLREHQGTFLSLDLYISLSSFYRDFEIKIGDSLSKRFFWFSNRYFHYHFYFLLFYIKNWAPLYEDLLEVTWELPEKLFLGTFNVEHFPHIDWAAFFSQAFTLAYAPFEALSIWRGYSTTALSYRTMGFYYFVKYFSLFMHQGYSSLSNRYFQGKAHSMNEKKRSLRLRSDYLAKGIQGFKIQCLGRFSRKQRSSKVTMVYGRVPLNTLGAEIDFAQSSIPIINSVINVKVWIHRDEAFRPYHLNLL